MSLFVNSPPPSDSTQNKQSKGQNDTAMSRQHPPRRRVMADPDEELGKTTVSSGDSVTVRVSPVLFSFFCKQLLISLFLLLSRCPGFYFLTVISNLTVIVITIRKLRTEIIIRYFSL